jgi:hypothetical protein
VRMTRTSPTMTRVAAITISTSTNGTISSVGPRRRRAS